MPESDATDTEKLDPTAPRRPDAGSGTSLRRPAMQALVRRAQGSLPADLLRRFVDAELMSQAAALALYAMLSLAPLLLILVWLTSALVPGAQEALMDQIGLLAGTEAERVARTIVGNAERPPRHRLRSPGGGAWRCCSSAPPRCSRSCRTCSIASSAPTPRGWPALTAWLRKRVFSLGLVLAMGFLLLVSMTISTAVQLALSRAEWAAAHRAECDHLGWCTRSASR